MRKNVFLNEATDEAPEKLTAVNSPPGAPPLRPAPLGSRGAVGAMSSTLAQLAVPVEGTAVVEIDTALIEDSFVPDRMPGAQVHHDALVTAIQKQGQLVPVLLRPAKTGAGRYQVAYGHRRVRALREIGRPVKAVVRELSDDELVIAQGQENNARRDLSFIEKAVFGATLEDRGFDRDRTIMPALNVDKTELSRLISTARALPPSLVEAIGPAPKTGRRRWMELAERLEKAPARKAALGLTASPDFTAIPDSDVRFLRVFEAISAKNSKPAAATWTDPNGRKLARIDRSGGRFVLSLDEKLEPAFGDFLLTKLPEIFRAFEAGKDVSAALPQSSREG